MARRKKPENETVEQALERNLFEKIANHANRSEKTTWKRKFSNMEILILKLRPIEEKILKIMKNEKQPLLDQVHDLRQQMVKECIHPYEYLVKKNGYVECKFCNRKIGTDDG